MRDMIFVSHANPEDNEFALWLALQLAKEGYPVWCDLTQLLGGEAFWTDIEKAIRERTVKFVFVLSRVSNSKPGSLDELQLARNVQRDHRLLDFIIPVQIDDLPPRESNIRLGNINSIAFHDGWAGGLARLLAKLERDGVEKRPSFTPTSVAQWWRRQFSADQGVRHEPESLLSNVFPLTEPPTLHFHSLRRAGIGRIELPSNLPFPALLHDQYLVAFAPAEIVSAHCGSDFSIDGTQVRTFGNGNAGGRLWTIAQEQNGVTQLLREAWERMLLRRRLPTHAFANGCRAFYFVKGAVPDDKIRFVGTRSDGRQSFRHVVGFKTTSRPGSDLTYRYWHFGIQAKSILSPSPGFVMKPHVLFSSDGQRIWENASRLHRARRSQCRGWWNAVWRDRILATVSWLAEGGETISLDVGGVTLSVSTGPLRFDCPVTYEGPEVSVEGDVATAQSSSDGSDIPDLEEVEDDDALFEEERVDGY